MFSRVVRAYSLIMNSLHNSNTRPIFWLTIAPPWIRWISLKPMNQPKLSTAGVPTSPRATSRSWLMKVSMADCEIIADGLNLLIKPPQFQMLSETPSWSWWMPFTSKASGVVPSPRRIPEWGNSICWTINKSTQSSWNKRPHSISSIHRNSKQNSWEFHTRAENSPWFSFCQMKIHHWNRLLRIWIAEYWIMPSNWCPSMKWMLKYRNWSSITQPIWILHCKRWMHILNTKSYILT